jgi:hypothetical protein
MYVGLTAKGGLSRANSTAAEIDPGYIHGQPATGNLFLSTPQNPRNPPNPHKPIAKISKNSWHFSFAQSGIIKSDCNQRNARRNEPGIRS